jgi:superfamily II DNA or RNA helicase
METKNEIDKNYEEMLEKIKINSRCYLSEYSKASQKNELLKIQTVVRETLKAVKNGNSVVIFVNYTNTINELSKQLNTKCIVNGEINEIEKNINIQNFNDDKERIIICNLKAGSNSISLHDLHGNHPRISFIMPTWSITDLVQSLGRIYRANVKTPTYQYIVLSDSINELYIQNKIKDKLNNISLLNSGNNKEPLFKIKNLIIKNEDIETKFGVALKINRDDKKKIKKEINNLKIKETKRIEKKKIIFTNNDYFSIIKMLETLKKKKYNTLKMNDCEEKKIILEQIDFEMNECDIMLQETLNNFT